MILDKIRNRFIKEQMSDAAKLERDTDRKGLPNYDPGVDIAIKWGYAWLCEAQDNSASRDGGVARHFSLNDGWSTSYPETTGYIIPTMIEYYRMTGDKDAIERARRMLDWLVSIQFPEGGFQGGLIDSEPIVPVTFNTGQILLGLAYGARYVSENYRDAMCRAADWLVETQDEDGCWRKNQSPYAVSGEKVYDTHVAWGLLEVARIENNESYSSAALMNINWALGHQRENGWFDMCCLTDFSMPLTHTIGYAWRGILEAYRFSKKKEYLDASLKTAKGLLSIVEDSGFIPGRLNSRWKGAVSWSCLTGSVQIAICWLLLYQFTGELSNRDIAFKVNRFVRRTMKIDGSKETKGAIKGSFPVNGQYGPYEYLNWACKFFIDANLFEKKIRQE